MSINKHILMSDHKCMKNFSIFEKISKFINKQDNNQDDIKSFYINHINKCISLQSYISCKKKRDLYNGIIKHKSSFFILKSILDNKFLTEEQHIYFIAYWGKIQRLYFIMHKFVNKIKYIYCNKSITDTDMCLEPLNDLPIHTVINIIDNNTFYRFRISDLINLINTKLSHSPNFFADPLPITNPYTNECFNDSQLYNIYFKIKNSTYVMPTLLHLFFISAFDIDTFLNDNECTLRDFSINKYYKTLTSEQKFKHIKNIIIKNRSTIPSVNTCLRIAPNMCRDNILLHMTPFLHDYLHCTFSLNPSKKFLCQEKLRKGLRRLQRSIIKNEIDIIKKDKPFAKNNGFYTCLSVLRNINSQINQPSSNDSHFVFGQENNPFNAQTYHSNTLRRNLVSAFNNALNTAPHNPSDLQIYNHEEDDDEDDYSDASEGDQVLPTNTDDESFDSMPELIPPLTADYYDDDDDDDTHDVNQDVSGNIIVTGIGITIQSNL